MIQIFSKIITTIIRVVLTSLHHDHPMITTDSIRASGAEPLLQNGASAAAHGGPMESESTVQWKSHRNAIGIPRNIMEISWKGNRNMFKSDPHLIHTAHPFGGPEDG